MEPCASKKKPKTSTLKFYSKSQHKLNEEIDLTNIIKAIRQFNNQSGIIYTDSEEEKKDEQLLKESNIDNPRMRETMDLKEL